MSVESNSRLVGFYQAQIRRTAEDFLDALRDIHRDHVDAMTPAQVDLLNTMGRYVRAERKRVINDSGL